MCFLNFVSHSLRHQTCESYNVFVNLSKGAEEKINVKVNSHSNTKYNQKVNTSLHRSGFKVFFFMLDKNLKDNLFIFVLERLDQDELYKQFDDLKVVFNCIVHDSELGKISIPSDDEIAESFNGNDEIYNTRIENRLSCNICHFYNYLGNGNGYVPECCPFDCYHYYNGDCFEDWKLFNLKQKIRE